VTSSTIFSFIKTNFVFHIHSTLKKAQSRKLGGEFLAPVGYFLFYYYIANCNYTVLELSKLLMYEFYYDVLLNYFGEKNIFW